MIAHPFVKLNFGLDVLRKRPDGFHDLETLFVPCHEIHDTLEIIRSDDFSATSAAIQARYDAGKGQIAQAVSDDGKVLVTIARAEGVDWDPLEDLTVRAFRMLDSDYSLGPVKIFLEKTSPVGAGLGGGSADAAFALQMISDLFGLDLSREKLLDYASGLGSDCAFFLYDRPMFGSGRGEILSEYDLPQDFDEKYEVKVVVPEGVSVSTLALPVEKWRDCVTNAFEETVFMKYPSLSEVKRSLYDTGAAYAAMSGSGSAFFAIYPRS